MADEKTSVAELKKLWLEFRDAREWKQFHKPRDLAMGISVEAAELLELFLWKSEKEIDWMLKDAKRREKLADEMADVAAYLLILSADLGIDLTQAIKNKLEKNHAKYPVEKSRGVATKYDEL